MFPRLRPRFACGSSLRSRFRARFSTAKSLSVEINNFELDYKLNEDSKTFGHVVTSTERWIKEIVIGHKLCPFAYKYKKSIHVADTESIQDGGDYVLLHIQHLLAADQHDVSTKLIVFPKLQFMQSFAEFTKVAHYVHENSNRQNFTGFELVVFHPLQNKSSSNQDSSMELQAENFTIRSPYPTIHLFKSVDTELEVQKWEKKYSKLIPFNQHAGRKSITDIQLRNIDTMKSIGYTALNKQFKSLYDVAPSLQSEQPELRTAVQQSEKNKAVVNDTFLDHSSSSNSSNSDTESSDLTAEEEMLISSQLQAIQQDDDLSIGGSMSRLKKLTALLHTIQQQEQEGDGGIRESMKSQINKSNDADKWESNMQVNNDKPTLTEPLSDNSKKSIIVNNSTTTLPTTEAVATTPPMTYSRRPIKSKKTKKA